MKILVIEDEENKCRLYKDELENEGYEVVTAQTGAEGIELFKKEYPDLCTLDIYMAHKDEGIDLLRQMKQMRPRTPIIMLNRL